MTSQAWNAQSATALFGDIAATLGLGLDWEDEAPDDVTARLPAQPGLSISLWLHWDPAQFIVSCELFTMELWIAAEDNAGEELRAVITGLVNGSTKLEVFRDAQSDRLFKTRFLEQSPDGRWVKTFTYMRGWPWRLHKKRELISFNGG